MVKNEFKYSSTCYVLGISSWNGRLGKSIKNDCLIKIHSSLQRPQNEQ